MSYIFDRFDSLRSAKDFAYAVRNEYPQLDVQVFTTTLEANAHDPVPFELEPPIVHVERTDDDFAEPWLDENVEAFGGRYAGT